MKQIERGLPVVQARDIHVERLALKADAVVVGSGAGGAVAAYKLAASGRKVIVLEAGPYVPSEQFTEMLAGGMNQLYQDHGAQSNRSGDFTILQGRCVGGSTVVNATVCFRTPAYYLELWGKEFGLTNLTPETLEPYFQEVERNLSIHPAVGGETSQSAETLKEGCDKAGIPWKPARRNVKNCALTGACLAGCKPDRKQSMLVTYLPWAAAHGAEIYADTHVERVIERDGRAAGVAATVIDPASGEKRADLTVEAHLVVLAAGAIQTPLILLRGATANSSGQVGKNFACHPSLNVVGWFPGMEQNFYGAWHSLYVDKYTLPKDGGYILLNGIQDPVEATLNAERGTGRPFMEYVGRSKEYVRFISLIHDRNHGEVRWENGHKVVDYDVHPEDFPIMVAGIRRITEVLFAAGAKKIFLPTSQKLEIDDPSQVDGVLATLKNEVARYRYVSYHPQGTCRMGADPARSVVNPYGESHDVKGLYITDASLLPTSIGYNPQQTVYTLSSYISDHMVKGRG